MVPTDVFSSSRFWRSQTSLPEDSGDIQPSVEESSNMDGWVWIVLFGIVISVSILFNFVLTILILRNRKKHNLVYFIHIFLFIVNLVDYCLLIFEFSLGVDHVYPYGKISCAVYQLAVRSNPVLQSATVLALLYHSYSRVFGRGEDRVASRQGRWNGGSLTFFALAAVLISAAALVAAPTTGFATLVVIGDKKYCEIDLLPAVTKTTIHENSDLRQRSIAVFYLVYSSILSYWLPFLVAAYPLTRLFRFSEDPARGSKHPEEIRIVVSTTSSFFAFYLLHASLVSVRHTLDAVSHYRLSVYQLWVIKIAQSLLWLVAFFWHFTRPALVLSLDPDLKQDLARSFRLSPDNLQTIIDGTTNNGGILVVVEPEGCRTHFLPSSSYSDSKNVATPLARSVDLFSDNCDTSGLKPQEITDSEGEDVRL